MGDEPGAATGILGRVAVGSRVRIRFSGGKEEDYRIVAHDEADAMMGLISERCPLAAAMMDRSAGAEVRARTPEGIWVFRVLSVE